MSFKEQDKIALSDDDMGQVIGGFSLNYLIGGSGSGASAVTMEQRIFPGSTGIGAKTLQGGTTAGVKICPRCSTPLSGPVCGKCGWSLLTSSGGAVEL